MAETQQPTLMRRANGRIRRRWKVLAVLISAPIILLAAFLLAAWAGSSIARNDGWREPSATAADPVTILIETNGVHTGIVMPIVTADHDWREAFPSAAAPRPDGRLPTHVAVGWGEKEVMLNVPTWSDLRLATAARIITGGGDGLMRVAHYVRPAPSDYHRPLRLRGYEYRRLVALIENTLPPLEPGTTRKSYDSYEVGAVNYDARGSYSLGNTCNQWVSDTLAAAGVRTGWWTPLSGGVMKWVPPVSKRTTEQ